MQFTRFRRTAMIGTLALASLLPAASSMAAIPCQELDVIPAPDDLVVPMIYIELPISPEVLLGSSRAADRTNAKPADPDSAGSAQTALQNQLRCLNYGMGEAVMGNGTPEFRVATTARPDIENVDQYIDVSRAHLVQYGDAFNLDDGRVLIEYTAIINGDTFLVGEMVFVDNDSELYLDQASLSDAIQLGEQHEIQISEKFTREVKIVEMTNGDSLRFENTSEEGMAFFTIHDSQGEKIFEGNAMGDGMVGGEVQDIFVAYNLQPGDYTATVTFSPGEVTMNITIVIEEPSGTPEAATPTT